MRHELQHVGDVAPEGARDVPACAEGANTDWTPSLGWERFGNRFIKFVTMLRVKKYRTKFQVQSEFINALHSRYRAESIEITRGNQTHIVQAALQDQSRVRSRARLPQLEEKPRLTPRLIARAQLFMVPEKQCRSVRPSRIPRYFVAR
ncbi:MAG: hypothetical protein JWN98_1822 [Abditibacteriota bacterium]|nr:hypothetical protein [Abditibacteriota bacterium]